MFNKIPAAPRANIANAVCILIIAESEVLDGDAVALIGEVVAVAAPEEEGLAALVLLLVVVVLDTKYQSAATGSPRRALPEKAVRLNPMRLKTEVVRFLKYGMYSAGMRKSGGWL